MTAAVIDRTYSRNIQALATCCKDREARRHKGVRRHKGISRRRGRKGCSINDEEKGGWKHGGICRYERG